MEYGSTTPTEFEYYDRLDQEPYQNQMDNLCRPSWVVCSQAVVDPDFPLRLTALKTCSGNGGLWGLPPGGDAVTCTTSHTLAIPKD